MVGTPDDQPPTSEDPDHADPRASATTDGGPTSTGGAGWSAPTPSQPSAKGAANRALGRSVAAAVAMTTLGAAGWYGSGLYLENQARQEAADAWDGARVCLLGDGLR
ncbi:MAG: hypothetical protein RIF41_24895, partial [Polyangiaceae bacterium]